MQVDTKLLRVRRAGDGNKPPSVLDPEDLNVYYVFMMSDASNRIHDRLIYPGDFEKVKKLIDEATTEKKENVDVFNEYLQEKAPKTFESVKKLKALTKHFISLS